MTSQLNPYLTFEDDARQAMEFYRDVFGGDLAMSTFGELGDAQAPGADLIMHARLDTPSGYTLMASDTAPGLPFSRGSQITVSITGGAESAADLRAYWERLGEGGTVTMPMEKQVWGDEFGMCTDRFGIAWMVNIAA